MLLQGMLWEYKGNIDPTSYIKFRGSELQMYCSSLVLGKETWAVARGWIRSRVESVVSLCGFWIFSHLLALWCEVAPRLSSWQCADIPESAMPFVWGLLSGQELADTGFSTWVAQLLVAVGLCLEWKPGFFFVGMERMDNGKATYLSHPLYLTDCPHVWYDKAWDPTPVLELRWQHVRELPKFLFSGPAGPRQQLGTSRIGWTWASQYKTPINLLQSI